MHHNHIDFPFVGGFVLTSITLLYNLLTTSFITFQDVFKTIILAVLGVIASAVANYYFKKWFPKLFKK